uniref:ChaB domain protein 1 n=1 Tax=Lymantria dispar multicapsid nuclear polyhedrosis virus TaxID=10449 RepID=A0A1B1MQT0_NPVLD|nr:ChaB domain protein 1 [Lymantria dispar multiple nucleopolyhedrovirus]
MFYLNEVLLKEELPARARRLFINTFRKYHKLDGGDENIALHLAFKAVERQYVKLNNKWIPKSAAEEIVRHDIDEQMSSEDETQTLSRKRAPLSARMQPPSAGAMTAAGTKRRRRRPVLESDSSDDDDDDDENETIMFGNQRRRRRPVFLDEEEDDDDEEEEDDEAPSVGDVDENDDDTENQQRMRQPQMRQQRGRVGMRSRGRPRNNYYK